MPKVAQCMFYEHDKLYDYSVPTALEDSVQEGDVVVIGANRRSDTPQCVTVVKVIDRDLSEWDADELPMRPILGVVDMKAAEGYEKAEVRRQEIFKEIGIRARRQERKKQLDSLAADDMSVNALLQELGTL